MSKKLLKKLKKRIGLEPVREVKEKAWWADWDKAVYKVKVVTDDSGTVIYQPWRF